MTWEASISIYRSDTSGPTDSEPTAYGAGMKRQRKGRSGPVDEADRERKHPPGGTSAIAYPRRLQTSTRARLVGAGAVAACCIAVGIYVATDDHNFCDELDDVIAASHDSFASIRGDLIDSAAGEYTTTTTLDGADRCSIVVDAEHALHLCDWEHDLASSASVGAYDERVEDLQSCATPGSSLRADAPVNHPDLWTSTYLVRSDAEVSVSLKNKSVLGKSFVSVGVEVTVDS